MAFPQGLSRSKVHLPLVTADTFPRMSSGLIGVSLSREASPRVWTLRWPFSRSIFIIRWIRIAVLSTWTAAKRTISPNLSLRQSQGSIITVSPGHIKGFMLPPRGLRDTHFPEPSKSETTAQNRVSDDSEFTSCGSQLIRYSLLESG
jgi:hypothetical protein